MKMVRILLSLLTLILTVTFASAAGPDGFDRKVLEWAKEAAERCARVLETAIDNGTLTEQQVFDTLYIPIPGTYPQKFNTSYDSYTDKHILPIEEEYLARDSRMVFIVLLDRNGYLPTHNKKFSNPLTGDKLKDIVGNRTKRIFNDKTGFMAARNTAPYLLQKYRRDTGEIIKDLSVPVRVKGRHWGAIRFGYKAE